MIGKFMLRFVRTALAVIGGITLIGFAMQVRGWYKNNRAQIRARLVAHMVHKQTQARINAATKPDTSGSVPSSFGDFIRGLETPQGIGLNPFIGADTIERLIREAPNILGAGLDAMMDNPPDGSNVEQGLKQYERAITERRTARRRSRR